MRDEVEGPGQVDALTAWAMDDFVARLKDADLPDVRRVLLYGSRAKGDARADSDIDVAVVFRGERPQSYPFPLLRRLTRIAYDVLLSSGCEAHLSPRPVFEGQLKNPSSQANPAFYANVATDGLEWSGRHG